MAENRKSQNKQGDATFRVNKTNRWWLNTEGTIRGSEHMPQIWGYSFTLKNSVSSVGAHSDSNLWLDSNLTQCQRVQACLCSLRLVNRLFG